MSSNTPRPTKWHIPMVTRHSDLRSLETCPASFLLGHVHEGKPNIPMLIGDLVHGQIDRTISEGLSLDDSLRSLTSSTLREYKLTRGISTIRTRDKSPRSMIKVTTDYFRTWHRLVHPDSPERLAIFRQYDWPPQSEKVYVRDELQGTKYGQWCTLDAVFSGSDKPLIIDWKTSVREQGDSSQLDFYRLVAGLQSADAAYLNLHNGELEWAEPYPGDDVVLARIRQGEQLKDKMLTEMPEVRPNDFCGFCPVQAQCRVFNQGKYAYIKRNLIPMLEVHAA